eukprot:gnl/TRDRNA2_/TRDRNA2_174289_c0_seq2.p1 gnl/TRDRNA2_/TRDRNA2_174289_c0~~gnl/TRDRNA2_/TRDRNA2_174289_c0_seq2.p1  ORF type:complete len:830 (+),score=110.40 gnl/TRDRNA2_/TRDRNA2_174289_c0_seq2:86-2575(+)
MAPLPADEQRVMIPLRPPKCFGPERRGPQFLRNPHAEVATGTPREVPRSVAAAAAAVLGHPLQSDEFTKDEVLVQPPCGGGPVTLASRLAGVRTGPVQTDPRPHDSKQPRQRLLRHSAEPLPLVAEAALPMTARTPATVVGGMMHFGDNIRLMREADLATLSTVPAGCAAELERFISRSLAGLGREHRGGFLPVTAVQAPGSNVGNDDPQSPEPSRRNVWQFYRVNPADGFPDDIVHYGQLVRIGQHPNELGGNEALLSCEPPERDGPAGAPYMMLARLAKFGHPGAEAGKKAFETVFRLLSAADPTPSSLSDANVTPVPVDVRQALLLVPAAPAANMHRPRFVQVAPSRAYGGSGLLVRTVQGDELGVEAAEAELRPIWFKSTKSQKHGKASEYRSGRTIEGLQSYVSGRWLVERLVLSSGVIEACDRRRMQAHLGLPRALVGRALEAPPPSVIGSVLACPSAMESPYARWERIRRSLLPRLLADGDFGFANFRKALIVHSEAVLWKGAKEKFVGGNVNFPTADEGQRADERCLLTASTLGEILRHDFALQILDEDVSLVQDAFVATSQDSKIDADMFADAIRGETSPGRQDILIRLYAQLQREAGFNPADNYCLDVEWLADRMWKGLPPDRPGVKQPKFTPNELMGVMPLLRTHTAIPRAAFLRWAGDLTYHLSTHEAFAEYLQMMWGCPVDALPREHWLWGLAIKNIVVAAGPKVLRLARSDEGSIVVEHSSSSSASPALRIRSPDVNADGTHRSNSSSSTECLEDGDEEDDDKEESETVSLVRRGTGVCRRGTVHVDTKSDKVTTRSIGSFTRTEKRSPFFTGHR